jgi:hypothetical protein
MIYGLFIGIGITLYSVILYIAGLMQNQAFGYISYVLYIAGILSVQFHYRNHELNGEISYSKALGIGVASMLFSGIIITLYTIILYRLDPGLIDQTKAAQEEILVARGMSDDQIDAAMAMTDKIMTPGILAISGLIGSVLVGTIISLITSIFVKKESDIDAFDEAMEEVNNEEK